MSIRGLTPEPTVFYSDSSKGHSLKLAVAIMLGYAPYVKILTGSKYDGCPPLKTYTKTAGDRDVVYTGMSSQEYIDFLVEALAHFEALRQGLMQSPSLRIVHDRARPHTAKATTEWAARVGVQILTLPPRSPDLDPLDYGVFGSFKAKLFSDARVGRKQPWDWNKMCRKAVKRMRKFCADEAIMQYPRRVRACIAENGCHIKNRLITGDNTESSEDDS